MANYIAVEGLAVPLKAAEGQVDFRVSEDLIVHLFQIFLRISLVTLVAVLQEEQAIEEMI